MHTSSDFIKKMLKHNLQIQDKSIPLLKKAFEAGIVEGRIQEKGERMHIADEIKGILNDFNKKTSNTIFGLIDYQDRTWPFKLR